MFILIFYVIFLCQMCIAYCSIINHNLILVEIHQLLIHIHSCYFKHIDLNTIYIYYLYANRREGE